MELMPRTIHGLLLENQVLLSQSWFDLRNIKKVATADLVFLTVH